MVCMRRLLRVVFLFWRIQVSCLGERPAAVTSAILHDYHASLVVKDAGTYFLGKLQNIPGALPAREKLMHVHYTLHAAAIAVVFDQPLYVVDSRIGQGKSGKVYHHLLAESNAAHNYSHHGINHGTDDVLLECPHMETDVSILVQPLNRVPIPSDDILSEIITSISEHALDEMDYSAVHNYNVLQLIAIAEHSRQVFFGNNQYNNYTDDKMEMTNTSGSNRTTGSFAQCNLIIATSRLVNSGEQSITEGKLRIPLETVRQPTFLDMYTTNINSPLTSTIPMHIPTKQIKRTGSVKTSMGKSIESWDSDEEISLALLEYASSDERPGKLQQKLPNEHMKYLELMERTVEVVQTQKDKPFCVDAADATNKCAIMHDELDKAVKDMQSLLFGPIEDSNVSSGGSYENHHPSGCCEVPICPSTGFKDIIAFPGYYPGRVARLVHEVNYGGASVISNDLRAFSTPLSPKTPITISGNTDEQRNVVHFHPLIFTDPNSLRDQPNATYFTPGQRVLFRGFKHSSNNGMFAIVGVGPGPIIRIADLPPTELSVGRSELLEYETSTSGATLEGCFGHSVGPASPLLPITVYGRTSKEQAWRGGNRVVDSIGADVLCFDHIIEADDDKPRKLNPFVDGELVRLQGFQRSGNVGVFRVRVVPTVKESCIGLADIVPCATNVGCSNNMVIHGVGPPSIDSLLPISEENMTKDHFRCIPHRNTRFTGGEILLVGTSNLLYSHGACCDSCHSTAGCSGWSFRKSLSIETKHGECTLFRVAYEITAENNSDYDSGTLLSRPDCGGPPPCHGHGICGRHGCICEATWGGIYCQEPDLPCAHNCSGNGVCDTLTGSCDCFPSFSGMTCAETVIPCPHMCSGHGTCITENGQCKCDSTWGGLDCGHIKLPCPKDCCGHGECDSTEGGVCKCEIGWGASSNCCERTCTSDCSQHGVCDEKSQMCICEYAWTGDNCEKSIVPCPSALKVILPGPMVSSSQISRSVDQVNSIIAAAESVECSGHGKCDRSTGVCTCEDSWMSLDCGIRNLTCPTSIQELACSGHGTCDGSVGVCECDLGWCGRDCGYRCSKCPGDPVCGGEGHGFCNPELGMCQCYRAWEDIDCSKSKCGDHGIMLPDGSCRCDADWYSAIKGGICDRVGRLCRCDIKCIADKSEQDTCSSNAVGCSNVGACQCSQGHSGVVCQQRLEPTGEQNKKNFLASNERGGLLSDKAMELRKAVFLIYLASRSPANEILTTEDLFTVFQMHGMASESEAQLRLMSKYVFDEGIMCHNVGNNTKPNLKFNEFMRVLSSEVPAASLVIPRALQYTYYSFDQDGDGYVSFKDLAISLVKRDCLRSLQHKKSIRSVNGSRLLGTWTFLKGKTFIISSIDTSIFDLPLKKYGGDIIRVASDEVNDEFYTTISTNGKIIELDRPWTSDTSVGPRVYLYTKEDILDCSSGHREQISTLEDFSVISIRPLGNDFKYLSDVWRETKNIWHMIRPPQLGDTTGQTGFVKLKNFEQTVQREPSILVVLSVHRSLISQADPGAKKWCHYHVDCNHPDLGSICTPEAPQVWKEQLFYVGVLLQLRRDLALIYENHRSGKSLNDAFEQFDQDLKYAKDNVMAESDDLEDIHEAFYNLVEHADTIHFNPLAEKLHNLLWHAQARKVRLEARHGTIANGGSSIGMDSNADDGYRENEDGSGSSKRSSRKYGNAESGDSLDIEDTADGNRAGTGCRGPGCDGFGQNSITELQGNRRDGGANNGNVGDLKITGGGVDVEDNSGGDGMMPGSSGDFSIDSDETIFPPDTFTIPSLSHSGWCDMTDPFENPFCPTPNPMFNILIKMMIAGLVQPVADCKNAWRHGHDFADT